MNRHAILQQDYTQKALVTPRNSYPNANPAVALDHTAYRVSHCRFNPLVSNDSAIRTLADFREIVSESHTITLSAPAEFGA